ncbi:hypothetical protein HanPSC8_Chr00c177g0805921 [Helianthus annuus]|nr:hypothetical protein HanPSC8_Chr00c177g0805921 [Helianthus annuus]
MRDRTFGVLTKINLMDKGTGAVYPCCSQPFTHSEPHLILHVS